MIPYFRFNFKSENEENFSIVRKFFKTIKLEGHVPFRPLLFLYYIFRYIRDFNYELVEVTSYKDYLLDLIRRYKVLSFSIALPEKQPSLSYSSVGASAIGFVFQLTKSLLATCPQCIGPHWLEYG